MILRPATIQDIEQMQVIRNSVHENVLSYPTHIGSTDYEAYLSLKGCGWACQIEEQLVGFSIVDVKNNNVWALFILPKFQSLGIGQKLHDLMLNWYFQQTDQTIWLSTDPGTKAEAFYRKNKWQETGKHNNEIRFEMTAAHWLANKTNG